MDCYTARQQLSAMLDDEPVADTPAVEGHLAGCAGCTGWREAARDLTVAARRVHPEPPDLTVAILESTAQRDRAARHKMLARRRVLRWAVGIAAVAQLVLAIPALLVAAGVTELPAVHANREMASFDIAVAVGFLLAAFHPERARAFVPVAVVLSVCLAFASGVDLAAGATAVADEVGHAIALLQACLLWALGRTQSTPPTMPHTATS